MRRTIYIVGALKETVTVESRVGGHLLEHYYGKTLVERQDIPCTWAEGMVGAFAVFYDLEKAKEYAGGKYAILTSEVEVPERN